MDRTLVVLGIPWDIDTDGLREYMSKYRELEDCIVIKGRSTGRSRGFGYVMFASAEDAKSVSLSEHFLGNRMLEVKVATPKEEIRAPTRKVTRIFVARIPQFVTEANFRGHFGKYGEITDLYMPKDQCSKMHRGIGLFNVLYRNCPINLKEAVPSVIFASPRCADIPELMDIRKHFTAKYGKEFVSAAVELRPDSGVSRMLIEKLSTKSPDGPTKMKILAAIAEEHNVKWDPEAFEEKPLEDLLNGPNTFGMASMDSAPPPPTHDVRGPPNVQVPPNSMASKAHVEPPSGPPPPDQPAIAQVPRRNYEYHDGPMNSNEQNARSSRHLDNSASTNVSANKATTSAKFHPETTSSETRSSRMEMHVIFPGDESSSGMPNWNMQFKDAASAAICANS